MTINVWAWMRGNIDLWHELEVGQQGVQIKTSVVGVDAGQRLFYIGIGIERARIGGVEVHRLAV